MTDTFWSTRESYNSRATKRLNDSFETIAEATKRARTTPPKKQKRSHSTSVENIVGELDQLLEDVNEWKGKINWSVKAKEYKIRSKGQDVTPRNGGQMLQSFFKMQWCWHVNIWNQESK